MCTTRYVPEASRSWDDALITIGEAARLLQISLSTVRLWSTIGVLKEALSHGGDAWFKRAEILSFLPGETGEPESRGRTGRQYREPNPARISLN
jgi:hypothetical protein